MSPAPALTQELYKKAVISTSDQKLEFKKAAIWTSDHKLKFWRGLHKGLASIFAQPQLFKRMMLDLCKHDVARGSAS